MADNIIRLLLWRLLILEVCDTCKGTSARKLTVRQCDPEQRNNETVIAAETTLVKTYFDDGW